MDPNAPKDPIDLSKILLPKKEGPSPASAQRVNAGVLLEQEQAAAAPTATEPVLPTPPSSAALVPKTEQSAIKQLETYQGDIEAVVQKKNVSVVSIAAAEAQRRAKQIEESPAAEEAGTGRRILLVGLGVLLIACALGVLSWVYLRPASTVPVAMTGAAPFISVDASQQVELQPGDTPQEAMQKLVAAKSSVNLSLGLITQLVVTEASSTSSAPSLLGASDFITTLTLYAPAELLRTLSPQYLLGVHSYEENEPFLIFKVDDYETAYAGMLAWEVTMMQDLSPLFVRHPSPQLGAASPPTLSTGATSTVSTSSLLVPFTGAPTNFVDQVVDNHDARVLLDAQGNILLLWTFLDRQTLVITNNDATLREIIVRLATPAVQALP